MCVTANPPPGVHLVSVIPKCAPDERDFTLFETKVEYIGPHPTVNREAFHGTNSIDIDKVNDLWTGKIADWNKDKQYLPGDQDVTGNAHLQFKRRFIIKFGGFGDKMTFGSREGANKIVNAIEKALSSLELCWKDVDAIVDGDWLKPASMTGLVAALKDKHPEMTLHLIRTCETTHVKFLHSTSFPPNHPESPCLPQRTWYEAFREWKFEGVHVWHALPIPSDEPALKDLTSEVNRIPSGIRNTLTADIIVTIGGGEEMKREVALLKRAAEKKNVTESLLSLTQYF